MLIINIRNEFRDWAVDLNKQFFNAIVPITILPVVTGYIIILPNLWILDINLVSV